MTTGWIDVASVLLVNDSGEVLLQLRDGNAPYFPDVWTLPGGQVEPGETPLRAAVRELREETGLRAPDDLRPYATQRLPEVGRRKHYFIGRTSAVQADVVLGEGAAMLFVPAADLLDGRPYTPGTAEILTTFRASGDVELDVADPGDDLQLPTEPEDIGT